MVKVTLNLTPAEYDLLREIVDDRLTFEKETVAEYTNNPSDRSKARQRAAQIELLVGSLNS